MAKRNSDNKLFYSVLQEAYSLRKKKNSDYGASWRFHGIVGLVVRLYDKMNRLNSLVFNKSKQQVKSESVRDTAIDMINYATMLIMLIDEGEK